MRVLTDGYMSLTHAVNDDEGRRIHVTTIHSWDQPGPAYVLLAVASVANPFPLYVSKSEGVVRLTGDNVPMTDDPEQAEVHTEKHAHWMVNWSEGRFVAIPFSVASKLFALADTEQSLRGEIGDYQALIKGAVLPVDHTYEGDPAEQAKLTIDTADFEPHEGGPATIAFFEIDPKYAVVDKAWLAERLGVDE